MSNLISRRSLLVGAALAVPAALIVPELIVPKRTFFLPPRGGWIADRVWLGSARDAHNIIYSGNSSTFSLPKVELGAVITIINSGVGNIQVSPAGKEWIVLGENPIGTHAVSQFIYVGKPK